MSASDSGGQILGFDYLQDATSEGFNRGLIDLVPDGIFSGLTLVKVSSTTIKVTAGTVFIHDLETPTGTRIETTVDSNVVTPTTSAPYIVCRFEWANVSSNYMDFLAVEYSNPTDRANNYPGSGTEDISKIMRDDIILGKTIFSGATVQTNFDLTRREEVYSQDAVTKHEYFKVKSVETTATNDEKRVYVEGGVLYSSEGIQNITGSKAPTASSQVDNGSNDYIDDTTNGRIDLVYIDESGTIKFLLGTDAGSPVAPEYGNRKVIAEISRGAGRTDIKGDDITWIDRSERGTILTSSLTITDTYGLYSALNVDGALDEIAGAAFTFEGLKKFSNSLYVINSSNPTIRLAQSDSGTIYTELIDKGSNGFFIEKHHTTDAKIRLNPIEASGTGTAYVSMFQDTNSTGNKGLQLYKGDSSADVDILLGVDTLDSYILNYGKLGINTKTPLAQFDIRNNVNIGRGNLIGFNVSGSQEITTITTVADVAGSLDGTYFTLNSPSTSYYAWIDVDNGSIDPAPGGTGIEVDISTGDSASTVATALQTALDAISDFKATVNGSTITLTNIDSGAVTDAVDVDTGFTITVQYQGDDLKYVESDYASYIRQNSNSLEFYVADSGTATNSLSSPTKFLDMDYDDTEINFYVNLTTADKGIYFSGTSSAVILSINNDYSFITANETGRDLAIKAGIDNSHNIVTGSNAGGSYISLSETGEIKLSVNAESEGDPALDTAYLDLTTSICKITGVDLELTSNKLYFGAYANNDYITFDGTDTYTFYINNVSSSSVVRAGTFNSFSSIKYKENIREFKEKALDLINSIDIVYYNFKKQKDDRVGFIAENTHPYFSGVDQKHFDITNTLGVVLKAIQELNDKIDNL